MKRSIAIILTVFATISLSGQVFEGKIIYANTYKSKNALMTSDQWLFMLGNSQEFSIKGGNYKSVNNGTLTQWQLYINKDNKFYSKMSTTESIYWNDAGVQGDEVIKVEVNRSVTEVLGYKCDEVILTCKSGVQKYYFNAKLAVDIALYKNHKFGNWYDYLSKSNALPLKSIIETEQFSMESIAIEVKAMKIDNKIFVLPVGVKLEKSPF